MMGIRGIEMDVVNAVRSSSLALLAGLIIACPIGADPTGPNPGSLACQVPKAAEAQVNRLCKQLQETEGIAQADCLYEFLRRGIEQYSQSTARVAAEKARQSVLHSAVSELQDDFPPASRVEE